MRCQPSHISPIWYRQSDTTAPRDMISFVSPVKVTRLHSTERWKNVARLLQSTFQKSSIVFRILPSENPRASVKMLGSFGCDICSAVIALTNVT